MLVPPANDSKDHVRLREKNLAGREDDYTSWIDGYI